ncbi:DUF1796 family putative cysteine peptidase [Methylorubrum podarium]|uniref:DUF1796 family putative cysteine peptidase n=1 Tax=Methylorubrum podarium TaxID=200476 RepID=A0ABV1QR38_9HYPH
MRLDDVKKGYDLFIGIGSACNPAMAFDRHGLRKFSLPLDWSVTLDPMDVVRLFDGRFAGYMERSNLELISGGAKVHDEDQWQLGSPSKDAPSSYFVRDSKFNVISVHDFRVIEGQPWDASYESFRQKLEIRIARLFRSLEEADSVLFVRWADLQKSKTELHRPQDLAKNAALIHRSLSDATRGRADLLILRPAANAEVITDLEDERDGICVVEVPNRPADCAIWDEILQGMSLSEKASARALEAMRA